MSTLTTPQYTVLAPGDGLRVASGPGRDLIFKVTGEETGGAFDYLIVEVAPNGGPPLHVHHKQDETIHALKGRYKVQIGEETFVIEEGGFAYLPCGIPTRVPQPHRRARRAHRGLHPGRHSQVLRRASAVARAAPRPGGNRGGVREARHVVLGPPLTAD